MEAPVARNTMAPPAGVTRTRTRYSLLVTTPNAPHTRGRNTTSITDVLTMLVEAHSVISSSAAQQLTTVDTLSRISGDRWVTNLVQMWCRHGDKLVLAAWRGLRAVLALGEACEAATIVQAKARQRNAQQQLAVARLAATMINAAASKGDGGALAAAPRVCGSYGHSSRVPPALRLRKAAHCAHRGGSARSPEKSRVSLHASG